MSAAHLDKVEVTTASPKLCRLDADRWEKMPGSLALRHLIAFE